MTFDAVVLGLSNSTYTGADTGFSEGGGGGGDGQGGRLRGGGG